MIETVNEVFGAYCPSNGVMAAISNDEVSVAYSYSDDLLDTGYAISVAGGETFCRAVSRHDHVGDMVLSVTNSTPVATNGWHYYHDNCRRPVSRNADAFAYNSRGEVTNAVVSGVAESHAYDSAGNHDSAVRDDETLYFGVNGLNQVNYRSIFGVGTSHLSFDSNGCLVQSAPNYPYDPFDTWSYTYDAKSRLTSASRRSYGHADSEFIVSNRYDHLDRRVQKITPAATHTYFYDGWMLIKEVVANTNGTTDVIEYHWGKDLSGTIGGAGGVGGLLYLSISNSSTPNSSTRQLYVPWYDAYGNVMGYWDAQGNVVAEYTYDAFGKLISSSGPMADVFAIRYSTKYFDIETGLYYYGYRFYSPELMRWITRDPIGEAGGVNLYAMCANDPIGDVDVLGLYELTLISDNTVEDDVLMWYLHSNVGNVVRSNIRSQKHLLDVIRRENAKHGSLVTVLNLSGHGLASGSGVSFLAGGEFDVGKSHTALKPLLARGATIRIWSCEAASTYIKCSNLKTAAEALDATIFANTGDVAAGPDGGTFGRLVRDVVAWIIGGTEGEWMRFVPHPKIQSKGWTTGPRVFKIQKEERRTNE
ncbi:MAG: RHS repeat-associated core domain-containing protein [Kiritimatiellae bacterium]|nr:RHS repeat-associated core domain-containing protein [Kiritimatiellia bacterium]